MIVRVGPVGALIVIAVLAGAYAVNMQGSVHATEVAYHDDIKRLATAEGDVANAMIDETQGHEDRLDRALDWAVTMRARVPEMKQTLDERTGDYHTAIGVSAFFGVAAIALFIFLLRRRARG